MCGAQVVSTAIIAPLGAVSVAANAFAVTAESICYMPGYGIANAAAALVGRSVGAGDMEKAKRCGNICDRNFICHIPSLPFQIIVLFLQNKSSKNKQTAEKLLHFRQFVMHFLLGM